MVNFHHFSYVYQEVEEIFRPCVRHDRAVVLHGWIDDHPPKTGQVTTFLSFRKPPFLLDQLSNHHENHLKSP